MPKAKRRWLMTVVTAILAWSFLLCWGAALVLTDRFRVTQALYWIPGEGWLLGTFVWLGLAWCGASGNATAMRRVRRVAFVVACAALLFTIVVRWRAYRYLLPARDQNGTMRVLHWNPAMGASRHFEQTVMAQNADLLVLTNPPRRTDWSVLREALGGFIVRGTNTVVVTSDPILDWGYTTLGMRGRMYVAPGVASTRTDPGHALIVRIDTTERLGRRLTVWVLDLPSDPTLGRMSIVRSVRDTLASYKGHARSVDAEGNVHRSPVDGFPPPDLIIGDLNIPRGSASLRVLCGGLTNCYDQAGRGYAASWPRVFPLLHIDQAFVGPVLRTRRYRLVDPGSGLHRMQVFEVVGRSGRRGAD